MSNLLHQRCQNAVTAMAEATIHEHLAQLSGWHLDRSVDTPAIAKSFAFRNFHETIAFVNALAWICHTEDHHPLLSVSFDRCVVRFNTHSVGGVSVNDFICATKVDALIAFVA